MITILYFFGGSYMLKIKFASSLITIAIISSFSLPSFAQRVVIQVDNENKGIIKALTKQFGGEIHIDSNGFIAVSFNGKSLNQINGIMNNPHVKLIEIDHKRALLASYSDDTGDPAISQLTPYAIKQSKANTIEFNPPSEIKVCVIDSGLDTSNLDFDTSSITGSWDPGTGDPFVHGGPHGTHVAGTIGAVNNNIGVVGMAPGVSMHIIKVFEETGWAYSSTLASAANICANQGADIISMSLGGGSPNSTEESAFNNFVSNGGLVVAAAGNDGNTARSYPAGYSSIMMVGANDANGNIADFSQFPSCDTTTGRGKKRRTVTDETICVEITAGGVDTLSTYPIGLGSVASLTADGTGYANAAMENNGSASGSTYFMGTAESIDTLAAGKICMIDRGAISFHDKVDNCENSGGIGAVIINSVPGMLYGTLGSPNLTSIPAVGADLSNRSALVNSVTASINISTGDYGYMSGTSMATPAVAGVAALVWSYYPDCTGEQVRTVLKTTALDAGDAGHDVKFGSGIVQADSALSKLASNCGEEGSGGGDTGGGEDPSGLFNLSTHTYKVKGIQHVDLSWDSTSGAVNIYRDGQPVDSNISGYSYTQNLNRKGGGNYLYKICEVSSSICSDEIPAVF